MGLKVGDEVYYPDTKQTGVVIEVDETHVRVHWNGDCLPQWSEQSKVTKPTKLERALK